MKKNILKIFLASPDDIKDDRNYVYEASERLNRAMSKSSDWKIEVLSWEDETPACSRPQDVINKQIDQCDLFIGLLWRKWGEDSGKYSSGFEEEFERVKERNIRTGNPEIWLYFKKVDEDSLKDPGEQLKKVIEFKHNRITEKDILYREYQDSEHWKTLIYDHLLTYILELSKTLKEEIELQKYSVKQYDTIQKQSILTKKIDKNDRRIPTELIDIFNKVSNQLNSGTDIKIDFWETTRIYLTVSLYYSETSVGEFPDNHLVNLVYTKKDEWVLKFEEIIFLFRSFVGNRNDYQPVWFWFRNFKEKIIVKLLLWLSKNDKKDMVRRGAVQLLKDAKIVLNNEKLFKAWLESEDTNIILNSILILKNNQSFNFLHLIDQFTNHKDDLIRKEALQTKIELMYLKNPNEAFVYLIESGSEIPISIKNDLKNMRNRVNNSLLIKALKNAHASVRLSCAEYLRKSNLLSKEQCLMLFNDEDIKVRKEGLLRYIEIENNIDEKFIEQVLNKDSSSESDNPLLSALYTIHVEDFLPILYRKKDPRKLIREIDFYINHRSSNIYEFLATEHFELIKNRIRDDLENEFDDLKCESENKLKEKRGSQYYVKFLENIGENTIKFIKYKFISAALKGLTKNGEREDVRFARQYLFHDVSSDKVNVEALKLLSRFGDAGDIDNLIYAASKVYGKTKKLAIEAAYNFSHNKAELLERLFSNSDEEVVKIGAKILIRSRTTKKIKIAKEFLNHNFDSLRIAGVVIIIRKYSSKEIKKVLSEYIKQDTYYYDVVTWFDRYLFAKGKFKNFYKRKLYRVCDGV